MGVVLTGWALGLILASATLAPRVPVAAVAVFALIAASIQGLAKFVAPLWMILPFLVACYVVGGMAHGVKNTLFRTLIHQSVEPARHGQAFAAYNGLRNGAELIALALGGALTALVGGAGTLQIAGGAAAVAGLGGVLLLTSRPGQPAEARRTPRRRARRRARTERARAHGRERQRLRSPPQAPADSRRCRTRSPGRRACAHRAPWPPRASVGGTTPAARARSLRPRARPARPCG